MAREVIALMLQIPEDAFDVVVEPDLASLGELRETVATAVQERERAATAQETAQAAIRDAVARIRAAGFTTRDAGALLGVSPQRISQIVRSGSRATETQPRRAAEEQGDGADKLEMSVG